MSNQHNTWKRFDNSKQNRTALGKQTRRLCKARLFPFPFSLLLLTFSLVACSEPYGKLGGADETTSVDAASIMSSMSGVWYSHYGALRLDSYRIGQWRNFNTEMGTQLALFPSFQRHLHDAYAIQDDDYYVFYDDTVYGQNDSGTGGNGGWNGLVTRYIGIVRAVNIFNGNFSTGAIIIEYLDGAYPQWSPEVLNTPLPFFGVYYRVLNADCIQMANAVDLAALTNGEHYYTETATLQEAIAKNNASNDGEFISWGVVIPQDRER
ncbi:MAG: hypothetical protein LBT01_00155 [Spirochaetaceae bacterium]|jgi:hypothetical protein|nr:hypothetical protein [Spirochaetaceae bacterium]